MCEAHHCVFFVSSAEVTVVALALFSSWTETTMYATRTRFAMNTATSADAVVFSENPRVSTGVNGLGK